MSPITSGSLGSLTQSARSKQLKTARGLLLFIGIISILGNGFFAVGAGSQFDAEIGKLRKQRMQFDEAALAQHREQMIRTVQLFGAIGAAIGMAFIALAVVIRQYPVPATAIALVLYLGSNAVFGFVDPETLTKGIIIKVIIVAALIHSLRSAIAFQQEKNRSDSELEPEAA